MDSYQLRRAQRARENLEDEITKCSASYEQKAFLRQRVAHLWEVLTAKGGSNGQ
jgi:hypothetical protein